MSDLLKQNVYNYCKSFSETTHQNFSANMNSTLENIHILIRFSPKSVDDEDGLYLQIATSFLISQSLQQLSIEQQAHTRISIFLSENYTNIMYEKLEQWLNTIYQPYTNLTNIIRTKDDYKKSWKFIINYIKYNQDIPLDTIVFLLEDDYIFDSQMISDTVEFFTVYNPCFVLQTDYSDHCKLELNENDESVTLLNARTRLWRSIATTTMTYACRLRTLLAVDDILLYSKNAFELRRKLRTRLGKVAAFCAIPSYGSHLETLILPDGINLTSGIETEVYFKDWWFLARHAISQAQKYDSFPAPKVNERMLFIK